MKHYYVVEQDDDRSLSRHGLDSVSCRINFGLEFVINDRHRVMVVYNRHQINIWFDIRNQFPHAPIILPPPDNSTSTYGYFGLI